MTKLYDENIWLKPFRFLSVRFMTPTPDFRLCLTIEILFGWYIFIGGNAILGSKTAPP